MSSMCEVSAEQLLAMLRDVRDGLERMRDDFTRLDANLEALRRESAAHDTATRRQLGQVASGQANPKR